MTPHESWLLTPWTNPLMLDVALIVGWSIRNAIEWFR